jgi:hypothetical protein
MGGGQATCKIINGVTFLCVGSFISPFYGPALWLHVSESFLRRYPMAICMTVIEFEMFYRT